MSYFWNLCYYKKNFTLLNNKKPDSQVNIEAENAAVEVAIGCRLTFEWDKKFSRYVMSLSRFRLDEKSCFASKIDIMNASPSREGLFCLLEICKDLLFFKTKRMEDYNITI